jgi:hypothetical protein
MSNHLLTQGGRYRDFSVLNTHSQLYADRTVLAPRADKPIKARSAKARGDGPINSAGEH